MAMILRSTTRVGNAPCLVLLVVPQADANLRAHSESSA